MTTKHAFTLHSDPGHGWLEVDWTELKRLDLNPTDFSRYSYRQKNTFFLEEDCDATKFLTVYEAKHGAAPTITSRHDGAWIRNLPRINS